MCVPLPSTQVRATGSSFQSLTHAGLTQLLLGPSMLGGHRKKGPFSYRLWWPVWKPSRNHGLVRPELSECPCLTVPAPTASQSCLVWHQQALPTPTHHQRLHLEYTYKGGPHYHPTCCLLLQLSPFIPLPHTFSSILDQLLRYLGCSWQPMGLGVHETTTRFQ